MEFSIPENKQMLDTNFKADLVVSSIQWHASRRVFGVLAANKFQSKGKFLSLYGVQSSSSESLSTPEELCKFNLCESFLFSPLPLEIYLYLAGGVIRSYALSQKVMTYEKVTERRFGEENRIVRMVLATCDGGRVLGVSESDKSVFIRSISGSVHVWNPKQREMGSDFYGLENEQIHSLGQ